MHTTTTASSMHIMHSITVTKYVQGCHNSQLTTQPTQIAAMGKKGGGRVRVKQVGGKGMKGAAEALGNPLADLANAIPPEDQINFSPRSDKNVTQVWPLSMSFTLDHKGYSTLWPTYLDSTRTARQGRRIAAKDAVEVPSVQDLSEVLAGAGIPHAVQPYRGYPPDVRSRWSNLGRVLVDLDLAVERMAASPAWGGGGGGGVRGLRRRRSPRHRRRGGGRGGGAGASGGEHEKGPVPGDGEEDSQPPRQGGEGTAEEKGAGGGSREGERARREEGEGEEAVGGVPAGGRRRFRRQEQQEEGKEEAIKFF